MNEADNVELEADKITVHFWTFMSPIEVNVRFTVLDCWSKVKTFRYTEYGLRKHEKVRSRKPPQC